MRLVISFLRLILILVIAAILAGIILYGGQLYIAKRAKNPDSTMITSMKVSVITATSAKVEYTTRDEVVTTLFYGPNPSNLIYLLPDGSKGAGHRYNLINLLPRTTYYLRIKIGEKTYDNGGMPWGFVTAAE